MRGINEKRTDYIQNAKTPTSGSFECGWTVQIRTWMRMKTRFLLHHLLLLLPPPSLSLCFSHPHPPHAGNTHVSHMRVLVTLINLELTSSSGADGSLYQLVFVGRVKTRPMKMGASPHDECGRDVHFPAASAPAGGHAPLPW